MKIVRHGLREHFQAEWMLPETQRAATADGAAGNPNPTMTDPSVLAARARLVKAPPGKSPNPRIDPLTWRIAWRPGVDKLAPTIVLPSPLIP